MPLDNPSNILKSTSFSHFHDKITPIKPISAFPYKFAQLSPNFPKIRQNITLYASQKCLFATLTGHYISNSERTRPVAFTTSIGKEENMTI